MERHVYKREGDSFVPTWNFKNVTDMEVGDCFVYEMPDESKVWMEVQPSENHKGTKVDTAVSVGKV